MANYTEFLENAILQYLGPIVLQKIKSGSESAFDLDYTNFDTSLMVIDVRSFTQISDNWRTENLQTDLNKYLELQSEIITRHNGYIDSLMGASIFSIFGLTPGNHADDACSAAIECLSALRSFNQLNSSRIPFDIGIGINSGQVAIGNIGSKYKLKFTAMGKMVNMAFRMQGITLSYKCNIIISENTQRLLTSTFNLRELDKLQVKGFTDKVAIFSLEA